MPRYKRPSEQVDQLAALLRAGNYLDVACRAAGLDLEEVAQWSTSGPVGELLARAMAEGEARSVTQIAQAARENWQAAAWLLERAYPARWSRPLARDTDESGPVPGADGVDDLAAKRAARRSRFST